MEAIGREVSREMPTPIRYRMPVNRTLSFQRKFWLLMAPSRNLSMTFIPKNMCSSIRATFRSLECPPRDPRCAEHRFNKKRMSPNLHQRMLNMTRAIVFRDPLDRAISAYENSAKNMYIKVPGCESSLNCTFAEWVNILHTRGTGRIGNEHFYTQTAIADIRNWHYHYVLRMTSPVDQRFLWNELFNMTSMKNNAKNSTTVKASKREMVTESMHQFLTEAVIRQLVDLYHDDILMWSYLCQRGSPRILEEEITLVDVVREKYPTLLPEMDWPVDVERDEWHFPAFVS